MEARQLSNKVMETLQPGSARVRDTKLPIIAVPAKRKARVSLFLVKRQKEKRSAPWVKLGTYPEIDWGTAKAAALQLLAAQALGFSSQKAAAMAQFGELLTVGDLLRWYLAEVQQEVHLSNSRRNNVSSIISVHLLPALADVPLMAVSVPVVREKLIRPLYDKVKLSYLELIQRTLKQAYAAAVAGKLIDTNPLSDMTLKSFTTAKVKPKPKAFNAGELGDVIALIAAEKRPWLRVLAGWQLMYAMRINEVAQMCWRPQFDLDAMLYRLPETESKNGQEHNLPLTTQAVEILRYHKRTQRKYNHRGNWLFPAPRNPWRHIGDSYACSLVSDMLAKGASHDLRKVARSWWAENRIDHYVGELLVNHKRGILMDTYVQSLLIDSCRDALNTWHKRLFDLGLMEAICSK